MGTADARTAPPLIAHLVYRFDVGGLENGLVNLINRMPRERYRHAIIALTECSSFKDRLERDDVTVVALRKRSGNDVLVHRRLWRVLRDLRPGILHTRNLPTLESVVTGAIAGVRARVHGEHGRDVYDLDGSRRKYNLLRRAVRPLVSHYIAVSQDLANWLRTTVRVHPSRLSQIYNGVDTRRFHPRDGAIPPIASPGFVTPGAVLYGTVGRMQAVKDQLTMARAFVQLVRSSADAAARARLVMVGDGPLREESRSILEAAGVSHLAWLPGERSDVADCLRLLDVFVLPSLGEGISNTILEAMATGLPVIATRVGGNPELVEEGRTGALVPSADPAAMAAGMRRYLEDGALARAHGAAGRAVVESRFSMDAMVNGYLRVYDAVVRGPAG